MDKDKYSEAMQDIFVKLLQRKNNFPFYQVYQSIWTGLL
jgi:hypothetical protein